MASSSRSPKPPPNNLNLNIRPATPADIPTLAALHFNAFSHSGVQSLLHPNGITDALKADFGASLLLPPPSTRELFLMVAANDQDEIVGYAKWKLVRTPLPEDVWNRASSPPGEMPDVDGAMYEAFLGGLHRMRRKWMKGDPGLHLGILAVSLAHQGKGVGSALLRWGTELADGEGEGGLPVWLEASPEGYGLYRKFGFEDVEVQDLPIGDKKTRHEGENWGQRSAVELAGELREGCYRSVMMRRAPRTKSG